MPLNTINYYSAAAEYVASCLHDLGKDIVVFDIGARAGIATYWQKLEKALCIVGFEPDKAECHRLNRSFNKKNHAYYPTALYDSDGERNFYLTNSPSCAGFDPIDPVFSSRFPQVLVNNGVFEVRKIKTTTIDAFIKGKDIDQVSFMKVDVEGAELAVLRGAQKSLRSKKVLGVLVEVLWEKSFKDCPPFAELDAYLRSQGFHFYDLSLQYFPRNSMPAGAIGFRRSDNQKITSAWATPEKRGQAIAGDALYFRDPVRELTAGPDYLEWDDDSILKMVALFDIFNYGDCAAELLDFYRKRFTRPVDVDHLLDLMVPQIDGIRLSYDQYFSLSKEIIQKQINEGPVSARLGSNALDHIRQPEYCPVKERSDPERFPSDLKADPNQTLQLLDVLGAEGVAAQLQEEIDALRAKNHALEAHILTNKQSASWKMAEILLWVPRLFDRIIQKLR